MKVGIQFCGGCNPRIDRGRIAGELQRHLAREGWEVVFNNLDTDFVIYLSGCLSGCACKYNPKAPPYVTAAAATIDGVEVPEDEIVPSILLKVRQLYDKLERNIRKEDHERRNGAETG